ncbi:hypothetical protein G5C66_07725 [Nocardioides sp. KC13]|uniref:Uncharacterized protein n=1 Tax=Nocardioides turkmenicus TaxID=2711220 RepID=A0A6M1R8E3_9ACTN|nr:hypothetical protein [Nocardioides sp. KC13]NGN92627.1 hypothetical protein [Nocardioides sp. KC13]
MNEHLQRRLEAVVQSADEWQRAKAVLETLAANEWEAGDLPDAENRLHEQLVHDVLTFADDYRDWESRSDDGG